MPDLSAGRPLPLPEKIFSEEDVDTLVQVAGARLLAMTGLTEIPASRALIMRHEMRAVLTALAAAGRLREEPKPLHRLTRKERQALRDADADDRLRVDDPDRERLAGALHSIDCGWNCDGHGIMQPFRDRAYRRMADVALRTLAGRLLPPSAEHHEEWKVCWLTDDGGIAMVNAQMASRSQAEGLGPRRVGKYNITGYSIHRRMHERFADGSSLAGPWVEVDPHDL